MKPLYVSVDIETDGPCPHLYSMLSLGAVAVGTDYNFYRTFRPVSDLYVPEALEVTGFTREETLDFNTADTGMYFFRQWCANIREDGQCLLFVSDNAGFDWQFVNYYFHRYGGSNPFGFSPFSLTSFYKGYAKDMRASFKHLRKTKHTHNALDDARGNAEALQTLLDRME